MYSSTYKQVLFHEKNDYITNNMNGVYWEPNIVSNICKYLVDGTDFVDIGAHIGLISLSVAIERPGTKNIHCFECNNITFGHLYNNMKQHSKVNLYNFALGDTNKLCNMIVNNYNSGCTHINSTTETDGSKQLYSYSYLEGLDKSIYSNNTVQYSVVPLDSVSFNNKVSVVKIDVEGYEYYVLLGAKKFLKEHQPILIIEIAKDNLQKVDTLLRDYGYMLSMYLGDENYLYQLKN